LNNNKDLIVLPAFRNFTNNGFSLDGGDIAIDVTEGSTIPVTNVTDEDILEVKFVIFNSGGYLPAATLKIVDKVAPVINTATSVEYQEPSKKDSLTVVFSEPVKVVKTPKPFEFYGKSDNISSYFCDVSRLSLNGATGVFSVDGNFTPTSVKRINVGDSIRIEEADNVEDSAGNVQSVNNNIRREIDVTLSPFVIDLIAVNPFQINNIDPNNSINDTLIQEINTIDPNIINDIFQIKKIGNNYFGMIIQVTPDNIDNLHPDFELEGDLSIFDAVGNMVVDGKKMMKYKKTLLYIWNGRNLNNRIVGRGTYLAVASYTAYPAGKSKGKSQSGTKKRLLAIMD
jgi:hypothetical protein